MAEVKLAAAIREALNKGHEETQKIRDYVNSTYPHLKGKTDTNTFHSTLGQQRKKFKEGGAEQSQPGQDEAALFAQTDAAQRTLNPTPAVQVPEASQNVKQADFSEFYSAF